MCFIIYILIRSHLVRDNDLILEQAWFFKNKFYGSIVTYNVVLVSGIQQSALSIK